MSRALFVMAAAQADAEYAHRALAPTRSRYPSCFASVPQHPLVPQSRSTRWRFSKCSTKQPRAMPTSSWCSVAAAWAPSTPPSRSGPPPARARPPSTRSSYLSDVLLKQCTHSLAQSRSVPAACSRPVSASRTRSASATSPSSSRLRNPPGTTSTRTT